MMNMAAILKYDKNLIQISVTRTEKPGTKKLDIQYQEFVAQEILFK